MNIPTSLTSQLISRLALLNIGQRKWDFTKVIFSHVKCLLLSEGGWKDISSSFSTLVNPMSLVDKIFIESSFIQFSIIVSLLIGCPSDRLSLAQSIKNQWFYKWPEIILTCLLIYCQCHPRQIFRGKLRTRRSTNYSTHWIHVR